MSERPSPLENRDSDLAARVVKGDRKAAARLISLIESGEDAAEEQLSLIVPHTGKAHVVGITGPAGSGKSTLVWRLVVEYRTRGERVGVVAVDPTSPFTGGAVLGDRVRMQDLALDRGVFIRSMASRGALGGLARATSDAVKVLDAYGSDIVLVETVGAGQDEVDIARTAHTTVVVQVPGMGDEIQAIKAGILEVGDILVVNKADRVRADMAVSELRMMLETGTREMSWVPPILKTVATSGQGIVELADAVDRHMAHLRDSGEFASRLAESAGRELAEAMRLRFIQEIRSTYSAEYDRMVEEIAERRVDARSAARHLVDAFRAGRVSASGRTGYHEDGPAGPPAPTGLPLPMGEGRGEGGPAGSAGVSPASAAGDRPPALPDTSGRGEGHPPAPDTQHPTPAQHSGFSTQDDLGRAERPRSTQDHDSEETA